MKVIVLLPLLLLVILTLGVVHATNKGSYKFGFKMGFSDYHCASTDIDCDEPRSACTDGYINGWKAWCKTDSGICAFWASSKTYPSSLDKRDWLAWR